MRMLWQLVLVGVVIPALPGLLTWAIFTDPGKPRPSLAEGLLAIFGLWHVLLLPVVVWCVFASRRTFTWAVSSLVSLPFVAAGTWIVAVGVVFDRNPFAVFFGAFMAVFAIGVMGLGTALAAFGAMVLRRHRTLPWGGAAQLDDPGHDFGTARVHGPS